MQCSSKKCGFAVSLNSHDAAKPRKAFRALRCLWRKQVQAAAEDQDRHRNGASSVLSRRKQKERMTGASRETKFGCEPPLSATWRTSLARGEAGTGSAKEPKTVTASGPDRPPSLRPRTERDCGASREAKLAHKALPSVSSSVRQAAATGAIGAALGMGSGGGKTLAAQALGAKMRSGGKKHGILVVHAAIPSSSSAA